MKIEFIVGTQEQHQMELSFDHRKGDLRILMDGTPVLQDSPRLAHNSVKHYELNIGDCEKHTLALQLAYGDEPGIGEEPGAPTHAAPRLTLAVSPVAPQGVVPESLKFDGANSLFAASTAATA
jgi:hypothetical protein